MIPSLRIQGFKAFRDLELPTLGRVDLVTGKNNVGKTTVLEAVWLHRARDLRANLVQALRHRKQLANQDRVEVLSLFHSGSDVGPIKISAGGNPEADLQLERQVERGNRIILSLGQNVRNGVSPDGAGTWPLHQANPPIHFLRTGAARGEELLKAWDEIVLTPGEDDVVRALQMLEPRARRVSAVEVGGRRIFKVLLSGSDTPSPLESLGDGMVRVFELALMLVSTRGGTLLIDEFENGIHWSVQEMLWRFVFETASRLDVQVFATTHSWDCIDGFQAAAAHHPDEGVLIRLDRVGEDIRAVTYDEADLAVITRQGIEVR